MNTDLTKMTLEEKSNHIDNRLIELLQTENAELKKLVGELEAKNASLNKAIDELLTEW